MTERDIKIGALQDFERVEVVGFGRVRKFTGLAQENEIEILVAPINEGGSFIDDVRAVWIGCGVLDMMPVGSRWAYGSPAGRRKLARHSCSVSISGRETIGISVHDEGEDDAAWPPTTLHAGSHCFRLSLAPNETKTPIKTAALPVMELLRGLFGPSDVFLRRLFDGLREESPIPDRFLFDRSISRVTTDGSTVRLHCNRMLDHDEAMVAAFMVADTRMLSSHDGVVNRLKGSVEWQQNLPAFADTTWPFDRVDMDFEGRWISRLGNDGEVRRRFLITRLLKISPWFSFTKIEVSFEDTEATDELPSSFGRMPGADRSRSHVLARGRAPSTDRQAVEISSSVGMFGGEIDIVPVPRTRKRGPSANPLGSGPGMDESVLSTADAQSGADPSTGKANIRRTKSQLREARELAAAEAAESRRQTFEAVQEMAKRGGYALTDFSDGSPESSECVVLLMQLHGRSVFVVDAGTAVEDPKSLGIILPVPGADVTAVLLKIQSAFEKHKGRWRSEQRKIDGCAVEGYPRGDARRSDRERYRLFIEERVLAMLRARTTRT